MKGDSLLAVNSISMLRYISGVEGTTALAVADKPENHNGLK